MKKTFILFAASALLMTVACNKEKAPEAPVMNEPISVTLNASRGEDQAQTKTSIEYNGEYASLESIWSVGDKVYIYNSSAEKVGELSIKSKDDISNTSGTQYRTSNAVFSGEIADLGSNTLSDTYTFVYQGVRDEISVVDGKLEFDVHAVTSLASLNEFDIAMGTGVLQETETANTYTCAVNFNNKVSFAYLTTTGYDDELSMEYYDKFALDIKSGTLSGSHEGEIVLPSGAFYMPVVAGSFKPSCGKKWSTVDAKRGYEEISLSRPIPVTTTAGFWRLGRSSNYGPVPFESSEWKVYDALSAVTFSLGGENTVHFTPGNLQWNGLDTSDQYWTLASSQYEYLGSNNTNPSTSTDDSTFPNSCKLDLFAWGNVTSPFYAFQWESDANYTSGNIHEHGCNAGSMNLDGADGRGADWGAKFQSGETKLYIDKKQDESFANYTGLKVLTQTEWKALFDNNNWAFVTVSDKNIKGIAVYPGGKVDASNTAATSLFGSALNNSTSGAKVSWTNGATVTSSQLEGAGCLFLPAAGVRNSATASAGNVGTSGGYWSRTSSSASKAYSVNFYEGDFNSQHTNWRSRGYSVRLAY